MPNAYHDMLRAIKIKYAEQVKRLVQQIDSWNDFEVERIVEAAMASADFVILEILAHEGQQANQFLSQIMCQCLDKREGLYVRQTLHGGTEGLFDNTIVNRVEDTKEQRTLWNKIMLSWGVRLVDFALESKDNRYFQILFDYGIWEIRREIILESIHRNKVYIVKWILDKGFDPNTKMYGNALLHIATEERHLDMVKLLIRYNADVNIQDSYTNSTPLFGGVDLDCVEICKVLLQNGAQVNVTNSNLLTPLHMLAHPCTPDIAVLLIEAGCCINARDKNGFIPLFDHYSHLDDTMSVLIRHGSFVDTVYSRGIFAKFDLELPFCKDESSRNASRNALRNALKAGLKVSNYEWENGQLMNSNIGGIIKEHTENQSKLTFWCRITIRNLLIQVGDGTSICPSIQRLPVPALVKSYLMLDSLSLPSLSVCKI